LCDRIDENPGPEDSGVFIDPFACDDPHMARLALAVLGAVLGLFALGLALQDPDALTLPWPVHVAIGWSFVAAGAVAWRERPENRMGLLMTLTGIAWFGRDLDWFDSAVAQHASELSLNVFLALVAHQLVVFPEGTARSRPERLLVLTIYGLAVLAYAPSEVSDTANVVLSAVGIALAVLVLFVIVRRWLEADALERRALRPLIVVGPPVLVVAAASLAHDYIGIELSSTGEEALRWCALVYAGLPVAFLIGVLRTHLRRAILGRLLADLSRGPVYEDAALEEAAAAARRALRSGAPLPRLDELTPRELEVLALLAEGRTDRGIAKELYVTPKTVEAHVRSIFRKLDLPREETENRRVHAVLTFLAARAP
jgi:DNA-binding NarL/FixJ family response regulator